MTEKAAKKEKDRYKATLQLPKTNFSMRANLLQMEPNFQRRWAKMNLYTRLREADHPAGPFVLHDGPPYANGSIHLGHLLNKVLKDLVVRSRMMMGHDVEFVPGWDCHGLPIEHKVMQNLGEKAREMVPLQIRGRCKTYAEKYIKLQAKQMQALGTMGDYEDPYLTMNPRYEAAVLEVFADLVAAGLVYRARKPVHWSIANQTALAEAELEYMDREDTSVFVMFAVNNSDALPASLGLPTGATANLMIWTTTPWTLPANMAVAASARDEYGLYNVKKGDAEHLIVISEELSASVFEAGGAASVEKLGSCKGQALADASLVYQHPFVDRTGPLVLADYVTVTDGTGLVHTAPGHGADDFHTGLKHGLDTYCPVRGDGTYDNTVPEWLQGKSIWDANEEVTEHLRQSGHLFHDNKFMHSYPHDWRSKTPTIFRATEQWFISVDNPSTKHDFSLRQKAMELTENGINFVPEWGQNRMRGMLEARPDWCISRQRSWGLPIPSFSNPDDELDVLLTEASVRAISDMLRKHGSDYWFKADTADLLAEYDPSSDPDAPASIKTKEDLASWKKGNDIFDVWFESGSSWNAVVRQRNLGYPVDLYLEGSDQHRGWFQLSLLPALGATGESPFKTVLTHGFMVDAKGHKMSKSLGNTIEVEDLLKKYGADICRWWVSSLNYTNDIKVDWQFFQVASEEYRKVRNTIRFLLGNLRDFDPNEHRYELTDADRHSIDAWAMQELNKLVKTVREGYETYQLRGIHKAIFDFCNSTMSAVYMATIKDRLYCEAPDSPKRRRTQTVSFDIADALIKLVAPILVHTADQAHLSLLRIDQKELDACVHLTHFPEVSDAAENTDWDAVMALREPVLKALEEAKESHGINYPLDAGISMSVPADELATLQPYADELADLCGVSRFALQEGDALSVTVQDLREEPRCMRSWKRDGTVKERSDGGFLSDRDATVLGLA